MVYIWTGLFQFFTWEKLLAPQLKNDLKANNYLYGDDTIVEMV